jgi:hypothetical protein
MLTRVAVGQVRFNLAGLFADARGVAAGKELLLRFASLDRLVGFLRLFSAERTSDELWTGFRVFYARPPGGGREIFARLAHPGGETGDQVAATARLAGGLPYTGTGRHFVPARDARAPLGYDVVNVPHDEGDFCVVSPEGPTSFRQEGALSFERMLLRLQLHREPGGALGSFAERGGEGVIVTARRGLAPLFMQLLFREGVAARAAIVDAKGAGPFSGMHVSWLFQIADLPARLAGLCARTPGLGLYLPVLDDVFVAAGWRHPVHLANARAALPGERMLLFAAPPDAPLEIAPRPHFAAVTDLIAIDIDAATREGNTRPAVPLDRGRQSDALVVPLTLAPWRVGPARVRAALVPWTQARWLRRLLFALPSVALRTHRVAFVESGVLVIAPDRLGSIPFGQPLEEAQPGLLVPVGMRLRPALSSELLAERLGINETTMCVFPNADDPPFRIATSSFEPLERKALARADLPWAAPAHRLGVTLAAEPTTPPEIENESLGVLPLWGWRP